MSVARITEISATSRKSFEDAVKQGVKGTCQRDFRWYYKCVGC